MNYSHRVSVVVPVYNAEEYLALCLDSLLGQTMPREDMEILLVNDGSTDGSPSLCEAYAKAYPCIRYFSQENQGVSETRNFALRRAAGKYIMFLDSDDALSPETVKAAADFFDRHYGETDLVTYRIQSYKGGKKLAPHFRYRYLRESGVYDLNEFPFITQTTMNICVKNHGEGNPLFDTSMHAGEDQKYITGILSGTFRIGFCGRGEYRYNKDNVSSAVATSNYAYYAFETIFGFFETLFARWPEKTPPYVQAMFFHNLNWRLRADMLFPYHYSPPQLEAAKERLRALLRRVDDEVILNYPEVDPFHAQYFLQWKYDGEPVEFLAGPRDFGVAHGGSLLCTVKGIELFIKKFRIKNGMLRINGFLKSPVFNFTQPPRLFVRPGSQGGGERELPLQLSSMSHYRSNIQTNRFWGFFLDMPLKDLTFLSFSAALEGHPAPCRIGFLQDAPFQPRYQRRSIFWDGLEVRFDTGMFFFAKASPAAQKAQHKKLRRFYLTNSLRVLVLREALRLRDKFHAKKGKRPRAWLYSDCSNVLRDNALDQFVHDFPIKDGVKRWYVADDKRDRSGILKGKSARRVLRFGSWRHKWLFLQAEKLLVSFSEPRTFMPLTVTHVSDYVRYEVVYLQHGVLHAHMPWKYALDRLNVDKMVISTHFERKNLIENYGFREDYLLPAGMPRFEHMDRGAAPQRKILLGPSWRNYLVGTTADLKRLPRRKLFLDSDFYKELMGFLDSEGLAALLEKHGYTLELQLHPIMRFYEEHFSFQSARVQLAPPQAPQADYAVFITDFSSFLFDFAYLKRPILHFMPDMAMFKAGMHGYRELDLPLEEGLGPLSLTAEELLRSLEQLLENDCKAAEPYRSRMDGLFLDIGRCCDGIYEALISP